jgi:uncharacterized membrane protein YdbT with pleckstrin-like domain
MNPSSSEETLLWRGTPSQWINFGTYFFCLLLAAGIVAAYFLTTGGPLVLVALVAPALLALARWIGTRSQVYEVTSERIRVSTGLLSRRTSELELYRVRDYTVVEPLGLRLIGRGNVVIETADRTTPHLILRAVPDATRLKDQIRAHTERLRQLRGVRDFEINPQ